MKTIALAAVLTTATLHATIASGGDIAPPVWRGEEGAFTVTWNSETNSRFPVLGPSDSDDVREFNVSIPGQKPYARMRMQITGDSRFNLEGFSTTPDGGVTEDVCMTCESDKTETYWVFETILLPDENYDDTRYVDGVFFVFRMTEGEVIDEMIFDVLPFALPGDTSTDAEINAFDVQLFEQAFAGPESDWWEDEGFSGYFPPIQTLDIDGNDTFDAFDVDDFEVLLATGGEPLPEPTTALVLAFGSASLALRRRRCHG